MGLKRNTGGGTKEEPIFHGRLPGQVQQVQWEMNIEAGPQGDNNSAVRGLYFEGNYEDRRNFGVLDVFDTLGFTVSWSPWTCMHHTYTALA